MFVVNSEMKNTLSLLLCCSTMEKLGLLILLVIFYFSSPISMNMYLGSHMNGCAVGDLHFE